MKTIILAGGAGSRLWPLSRTYFPKQFLRLKGMEYSMFQLTYQRALKLGKPHDIYIVTNKDYQFLIAGQIAELGDVLWYVSQLANQPTRIGCRGDSNAATTLSRFSSYTSAVNG